MAILYISVTVLSYLLGSIPFGYLLVRTFKGEDIRLSGSGNIGATNVVRSGAKGLGIATLVLDAAKGAVAVWLAACIAQSSYNSCGAANLCVPAGHLMATAALGAVLGHVFPVWLRFRGGKGVATALGVFILLFWKAVLVCIVIFIVVVALSRYISLGSIAAAVAMPAAAYFLGGQDLLTKDWLPFLLVVLTSLLVILKHHQNIGRLLAGTESRLGGKKGSVEKQA